MALGRFKGDVAILSTINEVPPLGVFKGKIMTEFARANVSPVLTFKSVKHSKVYSFWLELAQKLWKYSFSQLTAVSPEPGGKKSHVFKFCHILAVRMRLVSCETGVNTEHYLPRTCMWPNEHLESSLAERCMQLNLSPLVVPGVWRSLCCLTQSGWADLLSGQKTRGLSLS